MDRPKHNHPFIYTVTDLAWKVGISRVHLHRILKNGTNKADLAKKIEVATNGSLPAYWLLGLERKEK